MADIYFEDDGKARFPTRYHGEVTLSRAKWDEICEEPERFYYHLNGDKVGTALIAPDTVRHHVSIATQFMYYKSFPKFWLLPGVEGPGMLMAVVIDTATQKVCTLYPTYRPKPGREYDPNA